MTKGTFIMCLGLAVAFAGRTQATSLELPTEYLNNSSAGGVNTILPELEGSPYLHEEFQRGLIHVENNDPYPAMLRYNAYQDEIQVKSGNGITSLYKREDIWATLGGETFKIFSFKTRSGTSKAYFEVLSQGSSRLLKRHEKVFREAEAASSSYSQDKPARFDDGITYYIVLENGLARKVRLRTKDILEVLDSRPAETYAREHKLKLRSEEAVVAFLSYLNAQ